MGEWHRARERRARMPGINLRFSSDVLCAVCGAVLGTAGSYATLQIEDGGVILFSDADPPETITVSVECSNGHRTQPDGCTLESWFITPRDTPKAPGTAIARLLDGPI